MGKKRIIQKNEPQSEEIKKDGASKKGEKIISAKISRGVVHVFATYNNTIISATDPAGNVLIWASAGNIGFKGTKKSTPFAASKTAEVVSEKIKKIGITDIDIMIKGIGAGRDSTLRSLANAGFNINLIRDITSIPHNGCRPPKVRRV
ncbi:MAG: 30S ribosomal protein S11 [Parcubacteria group bacterium]|nr:30S ribosomal protein S11 [Parcubacteria group bacterium]